MSGINQGVAFAVCRLKTIFVNDVGCKMSISGTGFWIMLKVGKAFVTNRHNIDAKLKLGSDTKYKPESIEIELRRYKPGGIPTEDTKFFSVNIDESIIECSLDADVAVILNPVYLSELEPFMLAEVLAEKDLADNSFLLKNVALMDLASFIGFAGDNRSQWWDQKWNLGIARNVNIASIPSIPFTHSDVLTSDVTLVAGLSFSGSSGSIVLSHEKGINVGAGLSGPKYSRPKIIGIMSGHWWGERQDQGMFSHSGLSYFTRAPSILSLLSKAKQRLTQ